MEVQRIEERHGHPPKRPGETFATYWQRISDREAIGITLASRLIHVTPQSIFASYLRTEGEEEE
jgi:hypothetical protein